MPVHMPRQTAALFQADPDKFDSRSLLLDRFVYASPETKMDEARRLHFSRACEDSNDSITRIRERWNDELKKPHNPDSQKLRRWLEDTYSLSRRTGVVGPAEPARVSAAWNGFLETATPETGRLHAQLQSRLMINMAGGVMENAGLCLDRFGVPLIPGSAAKGCARRAATQALLDAQTPGEKSDALFTLLLVFGWGDADWKGGRRQSSGENAKAELKPQSDLWWAMAPDTGCRTADDSRRDVIWQEVRSKVANRLLDHLRICFKTPSDKPWENLPHFAGCISFLPSHPADLRNKMDGLPLPIPTLGKLELDVVTCHHRDYYGKQLNDPPPTATDTEEPNPVVFPTVAPGHVFTFALAPLRGASQALLRHAREWLRTGLGTFGIGAKTNAGYGWFDASEQLHQTVASTLRSIAQERDAEQRLREKQQREAAEKAKAEQEEQERLAHAPPWEKHRTEYSKLQDESFAAQAKKIVEMTEDQRHGFVLALKDRRETAKRWSKRKPGKPDLLKPWQEVAQNLQPPIQLP